MRPVGVTKGLAMQRILGYMASLVGKEVRSEESDDKSERENEGGREG